MRPEGLSFQPVADRLHQMWETGRIFEVEVIGTARHDGTLCWEIDLGDGYLGIIPEPESAAEGHMQQYVGTRIYAKILEIDHENQRAALSRKAAVEFMKERVMERIKAGDEINAVVRYTEPDAVYLDIGGGVLGKMPRKNATLSRTRRLAELYRPGQAVRVKVLEMEPEIHVDRVSLLPDPWSTAAFQRKDIVSGIVAGFANNRPVIEVREGLTGIAPMPLSYTVNRGQKVRCQVVRFDREKRRLHLRIRGVLA